MVSSTVPASWSAGGDVFMDLFDSCLFQNHLVILFPTFLIRVKLSPPRVL